jgi:hypothetical protein
VRDRVEGVGDAYDAGWQRNLASAQPARVAFPVPPLVVGQDAVAQVPVEESQRPKDFGAATRVRGNKAPLAGAQRGALMDDVEEGRVDLPNVVEECDPLEAAAGVVVQLGRASDDERVRRDAPDVSAGGVVVGVDRVEESLERCGGKTLALADFAPAAEDDSDSGGEPSEES